MNRNKKNYKFPFSELSVVRGISIRKLVGPKKTIIGNWDSLLPSIYCSPGIRSTLHFEPTTNFEIPFVPDTVQSYSSLSCPVVVPSITTP